MNMLLSELASKDVRQLFICHKELFYQMYAGWSEPKKSFVADFLQREDAADNAGAREALFGHDAPMSDDDGAVPQDLITKVGPWGAVGR